MSPWPYIRFLLLPGLVIVGFLAGGWWNFITPACCFVIHPLVTLFLHNNHQGSKKKIRESHEISFRLIALLFVPVLLMLTIWSVYAISSHRLFINEFIGFAISVGSVNGIIGFTLAHEFIHRFTRLEKTAGHLLLLLNNYPHYGIEHVWGHHTYACTPKDPHTANYGESLYAYLPRAVKKTYKNAWQIERQQFAKRKNTFRFLNNRMLIFIYSQTIIMAFIFYVAGANALLFFISQSLVAILLLHIVNYLQHYGLMRNEISPGRFERIAAHHAWNAGKAEDGFSLFQLEKHADHHLHPTHTYEKLVHHHQSPEHPTGYTGLVWLALIPPLWFKIMHPRIPGLNKQ